MLNEFKQRFQQLEEGKCEMLEYMDGQSDQERRQQPNPKERSPLQVLAHVVFVEETVSGSNSALPPNSKVPVKARLMTSVLAKLMRSKLRIPTSPELHPTGKIDYEETKHRWEAARTSLQRKLHSVSEPDKDAPIALQMILGPMSASMVLDFLVSHLGYHWKNFPKARS